MQLTLHRPGEALFVRRCSAESITVVDRILTQSFVLSAQRAIERFPARTIDELDAAAIVPILDLAPEVVVLATGVRAIFPPPALQAEFLHRGIGLETMDSAAAARTFNVLVSENRNVVAVFLLPG